MGSIVTRARQNKDYLYYVYYDDGKRVEKYCGLKSDLEAQKKIKKIHYEKLIKQRKELDKEIAELQKDLKSWMMKYG